MCSNQLRTVIESLLEQWIEYNCRQFYILHLCSKFSIKRNYYYFFNFGGGNWFSWLFSQNYKRQKKRRVLNTRSCVLNKKEHWVIIKCLISGIQLQSNNKNHRTKYLIFHGHKIKKKGYNKLYISLFKSFWFSFRCLKKINK